MISISSFKKVVNNYDYFLFDQWGVLHNGSSKFPMAEECLSFLKKKDKCVILVSNSSRPTKFSINNLDKLGIDNNLYDYCITSGQIALNFLEKDIYNKYGKKCFPLKLPKEKIKYFNLDCTNNIQKANFAMIADLKNGLTILDNVSLEPFSLFQIHPACKAAPNAAPSPSTGVALQLKISAII